MLAHKVAQHYGLKTATVPCCPPTEGKKSQQQVVAARWTADSSSESSLDNDLRQDQQQQQVSFILVALISMKLKYYILYAFDNYFKPC